MSRLHLPKLYALTDRERSGLSLAEQVARLCDGGATLIQLREKRLAPRRFYREAAEALNVARARGARIIVNDRADIAHALGADGVHLGQNDLPPEAARRLLGRRALIGYSTHNLAQVVEAARLPVDYLAIGPVFDTASKDKAEPTVGLEGVSRARSAAGRLPLVAIGGITHANAGAVIEAGADAVAVIGDLYAGGDAASITKRTRRLARALAGLS